MLKIPFIPYILPSLLTIVQSDTISAQLSSPLDVPKKTKIKCYLLPEGMDLFPKYKY